VIRDGQSRSAHLSSSRYNKSALRTVITSKLQKPKVDPHLQGAGVRVKAAAEELERLGIADPTGRRVRSDIPKDMQEEADRDFGG